jgi:hypothetical protein
VTRSVGIENFKKYPPSGTYSGTEVCNAMRSVLDETAQNAHGMIFPTILMLVGGIFLDIASRRVTKTKSSEKNDDTVSN